MAFEFTSNTKIFIDYGAVAGGAGGAVWLQAISDMEEDDESEVTTVPAVGVRGAAGFITKEGGFKLTITEYRQKDPQVRWRKLKKARTQFMIMAQDENNGPRHKWLPCRVSKATRSMDAEGKHVDKIEVCSLDGFES